MFGNNSQWAETFQPIEYASLIQILFHMDSHNTIPEKKNHVIICSTIKLYEGAKKPLQFKTVLYF